MPVKIIHTADNHIGLEFRNYPNVRERLKEERLAALDRIVSEGNDRGCDFLVVAGDLFDNVNVPQKLIRQVVDILKGFQQDVLVLPGNHDYYEGPDSKIWKHFQEACDGTRIHLLVRPDPMVFSAHDREVVFYPCPCPSKHGEEHVIGWVADVDKSPERIHVGIAHGNVEGLGRDDEGRYFNMSNEALRQAGTSLWLLGHIHAPSPDPGYVGHDLFFMPGTHSPDNVKRTTEGCAWLIDIDDASKVRFERIRSGSLSFHREERTINSEDDIRKLGTDMNRPDAGQMLLDLRLSARLSDHEIGLLRELMTGLEKSYLDARFTLDVVKRIDREMIAAEFEDGSFQHRLLNTLAEDHSNDLALQMAYDLIKKIEQ